MTDTNWMGMTSKVFKVGKNSLAITIGKDTIDALGITLGSLVDIRIRNTGKVKPKRKWKNETENSRLE